MPHLHRLAQVALILLACLRAASPAAAVEPQEESSPWPTVGGDPGGMRYSPLDEIHRGNVAQLKVAWHYRHGDFRSGWPEKELKGTAFQATPLLVDGRLIFSTPFNRVIALDPETGRELWTYDPRIDRGRRYANRYVSRGVAYWRGGQGVCSARVLLGTLDARLIALDAATGKPCADFGIGGSVDLLQGIAPLVDPWEYNVTSPPTVVGDAVVVGAAVADMLRRIQPPGAVRAFNARSGALLWRFDTIPPPGAPGAETWLDGSPRDAGGASVWSVITADLQRGWVFLPVKPAGPDHYGGDRPGDNLYANSLVVLDARTGHRVWHFQIVHHDLWDYDLAAPPQLVTLRRDGVELDAVVQATKTGHLFLFDRHNGRPLFPVQERAVPALSDLPGERVSPTQPLPELPPPLVPQRLARADLWPEHPRAAQCARRFAELRNEGPFTPPSEQESVIYPGLVGGANWSGGAIDPARGRLYIPTNNLAFTLRLRKLPEENFLHTDAVILPSALRSLWWLLSGTGTGLRYHMMDRKLFAEAGLPCHRPPWGLLSAVDLNSGRIIWQVPAGQTAEGLPATMTLGPPLVTAGGLVFHSGDASGVLRAHDADTGRVLARFALPAGLHAGPISYRVRPGGPQFLVVAAGGYSGLSTLGDHVIAYALPASSKVMRGPADGARTVAHRQVASHRAARVSAR